MPQLWRATFDRPAFDPFRPSAQYESKALQSPLVLPDSNRVQSEAPVFSSQNGSQFSYYAFFQGQMVPVSGTKVNDKNTTASHMNRETAAVYWQAASAVNSHGMYPGT